jgi:hypothetical protein
MGHTAPNSLGGCFFGWSRDVQAGAWSVRGWAECRLLSRGHRVVAAGPHVTADSGGGVGGRRCHGLMKTAPTDIDSLPRRWRHLPPLTGLSARQVHTVYLLAQQMLPDQPGRPWGLPPAVPVLLVLSTYAPA